MDDRRDNSKAADRRAAARARRQHSVLTTEQLNAAGLSKDQIAPRVDAGLYQPLFRGTFFLGAGPVPPHAWWMAGVLAAGDGALLSRESAASLRKMLPVLILPVHVTVALPGNRRGRSGLIVHRSCTLEEADRTTWMGIPVTSPERTIRDLPRHLRDRAVNQALVDGLITHHPAPHRPMTRSRAERRFFRHLARSGLPLPEVNEKVEGRERDYVWHEARLVVELDGPHHDHEPQRRVDRSRSRELVVVGWRVLQFSTDEIADLATIPTIALTLARG